MAVFRIIVLLIGVQQRRAGGIPGADGITGRAGEGIVILGFQSYAALVFIIDKAQHAGGQRAVEIVPLGGGLEPDALKLHPILLRHLVSLRVDLAIDKAAHLIGNVLLRLFFDIPVVIVGLGHPLFQRFLLHT